MGRKQDFSNSVIYHIRHMESKEVVYVGSTTNFSQRKATHKWLCNHEEAKDFTIPIYCHIMNNGGFNCFEVIPIQSLKLENKTQLLIAEQEEMDKHETLANRNKAHSPIDIEERPKTILADEEIDQYNKEYRDERKLDRKAYQKQYRDAHKESQKKWREEHRDELIQYRIDRKDIIDQYNKKYYKKNLENNPDKYKEKAECIYCKKNRNRFNMARHYKSCKSKPKEEN